MAACSSELTRFEATVAVRPVSDTLLAARAGDVVSVRVRVVDAGGTARDNAAVVFHATGSTVSLTETVTDPNGDATVTWSLGTAAGVDSLVVTGPHTRSTTFVAVAAPGPLASLVRSADVTAVAGEAVTPSPHVRAQDRYGNPIPGVLVTFTARDGGGVVVGAAQRTDSAGVAGVARWTVGGYAWTQHLDVQADSIATTITATVRASGPPATVRIVLFGDSNTDLGFDGPNVVEASYVSPLGIRAAPGAPNGRHQLAGKLDTLTAPAVRFVAVNHGVSFSGTGIGVPEAPGARFTWDGVTRFEAEVLGIGRPTWDGGTGLARVQAYAPAAGDYAFVSLGSNDAVRYGLTIDETVANLAWMIDRWTGAGLPASHLLLTTLPPVGGVPLLALNAQIRALALSRGVTLIDLAAFATTSDGTRWRAPELVTVDGIHYTEPVRDWLAGAILSAVGRTR